MGEVRCFKKGEGKWEYWKGVEGTRIARLIGSHLSSTMGAGILEIEKTKIPSTIDYDEIVVILSGQFRSQSGGKTFDCGPGDVLWIPANTDFTLETDSKATIFYARVPMDKTQSGMA